MKTLVDRERHGTERRVLPQRWLDPHTLDHPSPGGTAWASQEGAQRRVDADGHVAMHLVQCREQPLGVGARRGPMAAAAAAGACARNRLAGAGRGAPG